MIKEFIALLKGDYPLINASKQFSQMLRLCEEMVLEASESFWDERHTAQQRTGLYEKDVQVNKLQRKIRKAVIAHLSGPVSGDITYGLQLMSLVKDAERLGDYAKNLAELNGLPRGEFPQNDQVNELKEISETVELLVKEAPLAYAESDKEKARELSAKGRHAGKRCETLVRDIAASDMPASVAVKLALAARFYKRMLGHLLNLLSAVLMPLHKLDYFDEEYL